ncbi:hypothetical protein [Thermospira aquatica]|uniref:Uncharacterized protein n=1 Tax=Thermospira aquatica TaxID=2828656 RepID=A0AAX3BFU2_9SPIR|nr:hypothetical protein [Thermospira aquatica]URA11013.1 hypothetical protein KDW03_04205 [Thermospira aquatica]
MGYHQLKSVEGYEDPTEVRRLARGKTLTIQDVVNAFKSVFTEGEKSRTLAYAETETTTEKTDKKTPLDSFPWKTPLPVSPYSPLAGFVLIVEKEERKSRRQQERRELSQRQQELVRRREELEKQLARAQENYEQKLLSEGQKLEAYEKARAERQALELRLGEAGLTEEERRNLQSELEKARQAEEGARQAYEEAKQKREQAEREKNELEAQVRDINESLKLIQQRRAELVPEDFREALEMLQEGEDSEGRRNVQGADSTSSSASSPSGSNSSPSGSSGSSSPSSSPSGDNSSEKKSWWQSITSAVGSAVSGMVQAASTAAAYIAQQASSAVNNLFGGNKSQGSSGGAPRQRVNSEVYNQAWENARKQWGKDGGKKPINEYGEKALKQAEYDWKMQKARGYYRQVFGDNPSRDVKDLSGYAEVVNRDYEEMCKQDAMKHAVDLKVRELVKEGKLKDMLNQAGIFLGDEKDLSKLSAKELYEVGHKRLEEATNKAMEMYGGKDVIDGASCRAEFVDVFTNKLVRASQNGNITETNLYDRDGKLSKVGEEYEYFMKLRGYQMEKQRFERDGQRLEEIDKRLEEIEKQLETAKGKAKERLERVRDRLMGERDQIETHWGGRENLTKENGFQDAWVNKLSGEYTIEALLNGKSFLILGEEGMGKGTAVGYTSKLNKDNTDFEKNGNEGYDIYNDRITVIKNGRIVEFNRASLDPTRYQLGYYKKEKNQWQSIEKDEFAKLRQNKFPDLKKIPIGYDGKLHYGTIAPGLYEAGVVKWPGQKWTKEFSLILNGGGKIPAEGGVNPAYPQRNPAYLDGVRVHLGTMDSWNASEGCQVIYSPDYDRFMQLFSRVENGQKVYDYGAVGYYFLLTQ